MNNLFNQLSEELIAFCEAERLPLMSADELLHEELTLRQRLWLSSFLFRWEEAELIAENEADALVDECPGAGWRYRDYPGQGEG